MTIKLLVVGALCAFLGSQWSRGSASQDSVASCSASANHCHGIVFARASPDQFFAALMTR